MADLTEDPEAGPAAPRRKRPGRRWTRIAAALVLIVLAAIVLLWVQRRPIASGYVDRMLAERGVAARYRIADLGPARQRLTDVVIGDPSNPDLVADWVEIRTAIGWSGPYVEAIRAGRVRLKARLAADGTLSMGAVDKLLPAPSGKPFALPAIDLAVADGRAMLTTPYGPAELRLSGRGRLDGGFAGRLEARAPRLTSGDCAATGLTAALALRIDRARPVLRGSVNAAALACGDAVVRAPALDLAATLAADMTRWRGRAQVKAAAARHPAGALAPIAGQVSFAGGAEGTAGAARLAAGTFGTAMLSGKALRVDGRYSLSSRGVRFDGRIGAEHGALDAGRRRAIAAFGATGQGTPVGPLADGLAKALDGAAKDFAVDGAVTVESAGARGVVTVRRLALIAASGARVALGGGGVRYAWPGGETRIAAVLTSGGGGLPDARAELVRARADAPVTGTVVMQPYAAGGARLALTPVRLTAVGRGMRVTTTATLSGPLGDGRVDGLTLPVAAEWDGRRRVVVNRECASLGAARVAAGGLVLSTARLPLCPVDGGLVVLDGGRLGGGMVLNAVHLAGRMGEAPVTLAAERAEVRLGERRFRLAAPAVRIGGGAENTHLRFATVDGRFDGAPGGGFTGGAGAIANVPLVMSAADGTWAVHDGRLAVSGALMVADAAAAPRFLPLAGRDVALTLVDGRIAVTGRLVHPEKGVFVSDVSIAHDLGSGRGHADLAVPGITFDKAFQPDELTPLTFGVIADVVGIVSGDGHIAWTPDGVTSTGSFHTDGTDLAAALGPVSGIAGTIRFTDLLSLESAPGQVATVATINPGIAVNDGTIRYQTLPGARVRVEEGRWPFAGGALMLEPTLLDFSTPQDRRMTFRITGMDAGQFLQQFDFKNLNATGTFDGVLPIVFNADGGRIENGRLNVRSEGGGTLAYVGEVSQEDLGFWGNLAFQSLKSLRYRDLAIVMNGALAGEVITEVRFAGIRQGEGTKRNFLLDRLQTLPLVFNVRIAAPFRQLIDSAQSFYDPARLIERNLPALLEEQDKRDRSPQPVQPR
ncbi:YdbH domain-containing protein [Sphingomonas flavalba]|uniref:YdbH domain-containing protein n=1 Tax=Sphingomonas flavalba TaxID=2559804 RepID=UPI0039E1AFBE